jgi:hypothetical protein
MTLSTLPDATRTGSATVTPTTDAVAAAVHALARAVDIAQVHIVASPSGDTTRVSTIGLAPTVARSLADRLTAGMRDVAVAEWTAAGSRLVDVTGQLLTMRLTVTRYVGPVATTEPLAETAAVARRVAALAVDVQ